jgi:hypothetical protein
VIRQLKGKCYSKPERIYLCPVEKAVSRFLTQIPRGAYPSVPGPGTSTEAEIKPVEPDQGNACAGKEVLHAYSSLRYAAFPIQFLTVKVIQK